jgi:RHS repeat-associated protein
VQDVGFIFRVHFFNLVQAAYNQFNLPDEMDFGSNRKITYTYNGSGQKIMRSVSDGINPVSYTNYAGMFVHEYTGSNEKTLKYIMTPEGRIMNTGTNSSPVWNWEYNLTDHLGNVWVVLTPAATAGYSTVLQETAYYPYGMRMTSLSSTSGTDNDYLYNGKQLQTSYDLNWYDYGARFYDPELGRWHVIDNKAYFTEARKFRPHSFQISSLSFLKRSLCFFQTIIMFFLTLFHSV